MDKLNQILKKIVEFRDEREWSKFHTLENLSKSISIESAELLEHFQWGDEYDKGEISDELADILIYSFLFAETLDVNIIEIIEKKLEKNEKRFPVERVRGNSGRKTKIVDLDD